MFTIRELIDLVIMTVVIGYIFSTFIKRVPVSGYDPFNYYRKNSFIEDIKSGIIIAAPAIVLHELSHKFVAQAFGAYAVLEAPLNWYAFVIFLRLINFPVIFLVGGIVKHSYLPPLQSALVAAAGPLTNLLLYFLLVGIIRHQLVNKNYWSIIEISAKLNLFLFAFNMIPIPGFDGFSFFSNILNVIF